MEISELVEKSYANARAKGWWDSPRDFGTICALLHSEVSEAFEEHRNGQPAERIYFGAPDSDHPGKPEGIPIELADLVIRIADYCGYAGISLEDAVQTKMDYNATRSFRHGNKTA